MAQRLPGCGELLAGQGARGSLQNFGGCLACAADAGGQGRDSGQALPGPLVHPGFPVAAFLAGLHVLGPDRAADRPLSPQGRVLGGPLGDIEVEGPYCVQAARHVRAGQPVCTGPACRLGLDALLPRGGDVGREVQRVDAGVVVLQILPEQQAQMGRQARHGGEVESGLPFAQVADQQVTHGTAGQVVPVDEFFGRELTLIHRAEQPHGGRRVCGKDAHGVQELVEVGALAAPAVLVTLDSADLEEFQAVPDGDVADRSALGGHDERDPGQGPGDGDIPGHAGPANGMNCGEATWIADACHLDGQVHGRGGGQQPGDARADDVAADQLQQAGAECHVRRRIVLGDTACLLQPPHRHASPVAVGFPAGVDAAGDPAVLPRLPGPGRQPAQDPDQAEPALVLAGGGVEGKRGGEQPDQYRFLVLAGGFPAGRDRAGRELLPQRRRFRADPAGSLRGGGARVCHRGSRPNRMSSVSGRYPAAGCGADVFGAACRRWWASTLSMTSSAVEVT